MGIIAEKYTALLNYQEPTKSFVETTNGAFFILKWLEPPVVINSVSNVGGNASFNFTPGPTFVVGDNILISDFVVETDYNGYWTITATSAGDFEVGTPYTGTEVSVGNFEVLTDTITKLSIDDAYKGLYIAHYISIEDDLAPIAIDTIQTTDNTVTTASTITLDDGSYRIDIACDALDDGPTDFAKYIGVCYFTRTAGTVVIDASGQETEIETAPAWSGMSFLASSGDLLVEVQGTGATTINWEVRCNLTTL